MGGCGTLGWVWSSRVATCGRGYVGLAPGGQGWRPRVGDAAAGRVKVGATLIQGDRIMESELVDAMVEAKERLEELARASYQNVQDALRRYFYSIRPQGIVGNELEEILPEVNFEEWYESVQDSQASVVSHAVLVLSRAILARPTFARIFSASAVQT